MVYSIAIWTAMMTIAPEKVRIPREQPNCKDT